MPEPDEVAAWMRQTGRGYRAASLHFGITLEEARRSKGQAPKSRARAKPAPDPAAAYDDYLAQSHRELEDLAAEARREKSFTAALQAKRAAMQARAELEQLRATKAKASAPASVEDHRAEAMAEVRRLRVSATEAGSYVAASKLLQLEIDLLQAYAAGLSEDAARRLAEASIEELRAEIDALQARRVKTL